MTESSAPADGASIAHSPGYGHPGHGPSGASVPGTGTTTRRFFGRHREGPTAAEERRHGSLPGLTLAALGVVFGDIGTSPLYSMQTVFAADNGLVEPTKDHIYGIISLVFWSITIIVTIKYATFVLRADNNGEGGILSLTTLVRRQFATRPKASSLAAIAGVIGASLFFGDSIITPAMSVLSAVEGIEVAYPDFPHIIVPIALAILVLLFISQRFGTHVVGKAFGPIMLAWFSVLAILGIPHIVAHPDILQAISPWYSWQFIFSEPLIAFVAMGAVVLAVTGAEALYADVGHFGRKPIQLAWMLLIWPCLTINYFGQGAMIIADKSTISSPFFRLGPEWSVVPLVILSTVATVIASQSVISGAFSVGRQAMRLGYLPSMEIRQTSKHESGQIYIPLINGVLFASVVVIVVLFQSSGALASAYGLAVTTTLTLETLLFCVYARKIWHWPIPVVAVVGLIILSLEGTYFVANLAKLPSGGWLPLVIGAFLFFTMTTWQSGRAAVTARREMIEGTLDDFLAALKRKEPTRMPGTVVYPHASSRTAPLALRMNLHLNHVLHERCILVSVKTIDVPYVDEAQRVIVHDYEEAPSGVIGATVQYGFVDERDVPKALQDASVRLGRPELDVTDARWILSHVDVDAPKSKGFSGLRRAYFVALTKTASSPSRHFKLPFKRTIELSSRIRV